MAVYMSQTGTHIIITIDMGNKYVSILLRPCARTTTYIQSNLL